MKICTKCKLEKEKNEFYHSKGNFSSNCKVCLRLSINKNRDKDKVREYRAKPETQKLERERKLRNSNKIAEQARNCSLKKDYNINLEIYNFLLKDQDFRCKLCGTTSPGAGNRYFSVDHDHSCCPGKKSCGECIRGLLCHKCNTGLGIFNDDSIMLYQAMRYIEKFKNT